MDGAGQAWGVAWEVGRGPQGHLGAERWRLRAWSVQPLQQRPQGRPLPQELDLDRLCMSGTYVRIEFTVNATVIPVRDDTCVEGLESCMEHESSCWHRVREDHLDQQAQGSLSCQRPHRHRLRASAG